MRWDINQHKYDTIKTTTDTTKKKFSPIIGEKVILKNIFFETNKSHLLSASSEELAKLFDYLKQNIETAITINGYTDNTGIQEQNQKLSEERAKAVADYLISKGINNSRVSYKGFGSLQPIEKNDTDEHKQQNRRVEFIISSK